MNKYSGLLAEFKLVKTEVKNLICRFPAENREEFLFDKWSLKDVVAHLNHWMVHDIKCLEDLKNGKKSYWEPDVDDYNKKGVEARKDMSWEELYEEFDDLQKRLILLYENIPEKLYEVDIFDDHKENTFTFLRGDIEHW